MAEAGAKLWHKLAEFFLSEEKESLEGYEFMEMAEEAGLIRFEPYNAELHSDIDDVQEGDMVWVYTDIGASMTTTWLGKIVGGFDE